MCEDGQFLQTWSQFIDFRFLDFLTDFMEGVRDFRVVGDPSIVDH